MKVLVTGATGFIGNYVIGQLLEEGHEVIASSAHPAKAEKIFWYKELSYVPFDLTQFDPCINYFDFFFQPDILIHLAWEGLPNYKGSFHLEDNLPRHFAFLSNMISNGLRDITITGTCLEYGMQQGCLTESMPAMPDNSYAIAKNELRILLENLRKEYPFNMKWVRLFYMYGKGQHPNSLLSQLDRALINGDAAFNMSGGEQLRDFLPVTEVAKYIVKIALQKKLSGIINCCSGEPVSVKKFVEDYLIKNNQSIRLNLGYYSYPDYEPMQFWGDNTKLKSIIHE